MPIRKLAEPEPYPGVCHHPEHNPPSMVVLEPGLYEHECPGCGYRTVFRVMWPSWGGGI